MKVFISLLILFSVNCAKGQLNGNCVVDGINSTHWNTAFVNPLINDNESGVIISKTTKNVVSCRVLSKYLDVRCNADMLTIGMSSEFVNYELYEMHSTSAIITTNLEFNCAIGTGTLTLYQPINDLNTNEPVFQQQSYTLKLPMPLPEGTNLQCYDDVKIQVCDNDVTNLKFDFEVDPPDFFITKEYALDENYRCYSVKIITKVLLNLDKTTNYSMIVRDGGTPSLYGSGVLTIEIYDGQK